MMTLVAPSRRDFLKMLLATPVAMQFDVEKLLWVPKPIITVPTGVRITDIIAMELERITRLVPDLFDNDRLFYELFENPNRDIEVNAMKSFRIPLETEGIEDA